MKAVKTGVVPKDCVRRSFNLKKTMDARLNEASRKWKISKKEIIMTALEEFFAKEAGANKAA